ncbi:venom serine protease-like [Culicoides brevitarsis]|uniref:venom serine protease-like n=1 Tax=Culicoides brevitarsis TaxID=469753 RepID=UPI00307BACEF
MILHFYVRRTLKTSLVLVVWAILASQLIIHHLSLRAALLLITGLTIVAQLKHADAWFETCNRIINLAAGGKSTVNSPLYKANYRANSSCRYQISAPQGFTITATCDLKIYRDASGKCSGEYFYVMRNGSTELLGSEFLCGTGTITRTSRFNKLTLAYTSASKNVGQFSCSISTNCDCGWSVKSKVVNGRVAEVNEYISMAGIVDLTTNEVRCGGSIISPFYVLSAAHCYNTAQFSKVTNVGVLVGDHDYSTGQDTPFSAFYRVALIKKHVGFKSITNVNDIALLKTSKEIQFSIAVGPACLPYGFASNYFDDNFELEAPGWGATSFGGPNSKILQTVKLHTMKIETCKSRGMLNVTTNQLCTFTKGKDTCQGDSGGNLYYRSNKLYTVLIVSYGSGCATINPAVNTKISAYLPWIKANAVGAKFCGA